MAMAVKRRWQRSKPTIEVCGMECGMVRVCNRGGGTRAWLLWCGRPKGHDGPCREVEPVRAAGAGRE